MDNKWAFSLGIEAKRWFHLESKVTVHLHNSALHQRAMNPIPSHWLWLNAGNGYPPFMKACKAGPHVSLAPATISFSFSCNKKAPHIWSGELCTAPAGLFKPSLFESDTPPLDSNYLRHFLLVGSHGKPTGHKVHWLRDFHPWLCFEPSLWYFFLIVVW